MFVCGVAMVVCLWSQDELLNLTVLRLNIIVCCLHNAAGLRSSVRVPDVEIGEHPLMR